MRWFYKLLMQFQMFFRRRKAGARLEDELQFHLEQQISENLAKGMNSEEARHAAMRVFGNPALLREQSRATWNWNWLEQLMRDLRVSLRTLSRSPGFALVSVLIIAIGIGANVSLFTIVRSVLLKPLPFKDPERLVMLYGCGRHCSPDGFNIVASGDFLDWQRQSHGFEQMAIWRWDGFTLSGIKGELPESLDAGVASWNLFSTLRVQPKLGRLFTEADDRKGAERTAILSWSLFHRRFQGDPSILGTKIRLYGFEYTLIGILPESFTYPDPHVELWVPYRLVESPEKIQSHYSHNYSVIARLKPGVSLTSATEELKAIQHQLYEQFHLSGPVEEAVGSRPMIDDIVNDVKTPLYVLLGAVGCLLLITCLNIANLLVARAATRRKEIAIRAALGSSRWRLCQEQLTESLLLCCTGGTSGFFLAIAATRWLTTHWEGMPRAEAVRLDSIVLAFGLGITLISGLFAGLLPALSATSASMLSAMQEGVRTLGGGVSRALLRKVLLVSEIGLTVVLLVCAGLLFKSFLRLRSTDLGCATKNVLTLQYALEGDKYSKPEQIVAFHAQLLERVRHLPGVQAAGLVSSAPGDGMYGSTTFTVPEHPPLPEGKYIAALFRAADPGYFAAMQIPLVKGRIFSEAERLERDKYVVISQKLANDFFPHEDPIGKHLKVGWRTDAGENYEIIGIVGDTLYSVKASLRPMMYFPIFSGVHGHTADATLVVRSEDDVASLALPIQKQIAQLDPDLGIFHVLTMEQIVGNSTANSSFSATLVLVFAILSLVLAAVGLYGVLSYLVAQRTMEIGVRIALGAQREQVMGKVLLDGLRPALIGLLIGVGASIAAAELIRATLYGTQPLDWTVFASMGSVLLLVAVMACALPAWRASRLDPMRALRIE